MKKIIPLQCAVQAYDWGDPSFIPTLLGQPATGVPQAELWIGAHPGAPAKARQDGREIPLDRLIAQDPETLLGRRTAERFQNRLPFLLKVLAAGKPLSIQAHPTKRQAEEGFARERALDPKAPDRNYKDDNHKPELIVALMDFYALRGFRPLEEIQKIFGSVPEFSELGKQFKNNTHSLRELYSRWMNLPQEEVDRVLGPLVKRLASKSYTKADREYWVLAADGAFSRDGKRDRGILSIYLLNLVRLKPGEAMYLPAGELHAYLEGAGVEIMANSDNVLRGGLTSKHVDVSELLRTLTFEAGLPNILRGDKVSPVQTVYATPAPEFELSRLDLKEGGLFQGKSLACLLVTEGQGVVASGGEELAFRKGQVFFIPDGLEYTVKGEGQLFQAAVPVSLREALTYAPKEMAFGTSGLRDLVSNMTDLEVYINTRGYLAFAQKTGDVRPGDTLSVAGDFRPDTDRLLAAIFQAIKDAGCEMEYCGKIPTPALTHYAMETQRASVMATGSHIPFDRHGIKFNKTSGEVLKQDEAGIRAAVAEVRQTEYGKSAAVSFFASDGKLKRPLELPMVSPKAAEMYRARYTKVFPQSLKGLRIAFYQHSAVGRELLPELLRALGAEVFPLGRSEQFVSIDTEALTPEQLALLQRVADQAREKAGALDALVSTDGDSDRPLVMGIAEDGRVQFLPGDMLGLAVADYLDADAVAVPISTNDAVERFFLSKGVHLKKTRIGSPYVIEALEGLKGQGYRRVVGWEANGGFLTATALEINGAKLAALPTRDPVLPIVAALSAARAAKAPLGRLLERYPRRYGKSGLIDAFPTEVSRAILARFLPADARIEAVKFGEGRITVLGESDEVLESLGEEDQRYKEWSEKKRTLGRHFADFGPIDGMNFLDGLRLYFASGQIAHLRPSGNAPQLRAYAVADSLEGAAAIVDAVLGEPGGIARRLETELEKTPAA